jgi:hypothetical protein
LGPELEPSSRFTPAVSVRAAARAPRRRRAFAGASADLDVDRRALILAADEAGLGHALAGERKINGITPKSFDERCEWVIDLFERLSTPGRQV